MPELIIGVPVALLAALGVVMVAAEVRHRRLGIPDQHRLEELRRQAPHDARAARTLRGELLRALRSGQAVRRDLEREPASERAHGVLDQLARDEERTKRELHEVEMWLRRPG